MKKHYFVDVNIWVVALAVLGGVSSTADIVNAAKSDTMELEQVRRIVLEVLEDKAVLVFSDNSLETVRRILTQETGAQGDWGFAKLDQETAKASIDVLRVLSRASGGFVTNSDVRRWRPAAEALIASNDDVNGKVDFEDSFVVGNILGYLDRLVQAGDGIAQVELVSNDKKLNRVRSVISHESRVCTFHNQTVSMLSAAEFARRHNAA